jgi:hypothetical protein
MATNELPPCGLYRTLDQIGGIPAGRLVYFHNHGDPGAGMYLPESWTGNRAKFARQGHLLPKPEDSQKLVPLPPEGFYRVEKQFHCCEKKCRLYEVDALVQLGYNGEGTPILFEPQWEGAKIALPDRGTRIDFEALLAIAPLRVLTKQGGEGGADPFFMH